MKKNLLVCVLAWFLTFQSKSQYASVWSAYPPAYELSAGFVTHNTPGYFWLGYLSTVQNISSFWHVNKNFCILGSGSSAIWSAYQIFDANNCSGTLSQVLNGSGVTAIETIGVQGERYALAGAYDKACYFTTLDKFGNVISAMSYPFPYQANTAAAMPAKPILVESDHMGEYYICGYFDSNMYVINVSLTGGVLWSSFYSLGNKIIPKDVIMNPYNTGELMIVGETELSGTDSQGFLIAIDGNSGTVINSRVFGHPGKKDGFGTIIASANTTNNLNSLNSGEFIVGGYTYAQNSIPGSTAWVLKLNAAGNISWSKVLTPSMGTNQGVIDIVERLNTFNNYEYYALLNSSVGMQVLKLNDQGNPFPVSSPNALFNEFVYDLPALNASKATSISYMNSQAFSVDVGIQVFGTASNFTGFSSSYVVSAYFNGETNCFRTLGNIQGLQTGPQTGAGMPASKFGSLSSCSNFQILAFFPGGSINYPCSGLVPAGSNQRGIPSGVNQQLEEEESFKVFPNPVSDKTQVNYSCSDNSKISIDVYSALGQLVWHVQPAAELAGNYRQEVDFSSLDIAGGVYFVNTTVDGKTHKQKVIYNK